MILTQQPIEIEIIRWRWVSVCFGRNAIVLILKRGVDTGVLQHKKHSSQEVFKSELCRASLAFQGALMFSPLRKDRIPAKAFVNEDIDMAFHDSESYNLKFRRPRWQSFAAVDKI